MHSELQLCNVSVYPFKGFLWQIGVLTSVARKTVSFVTAPAHAFSIDASGARVTPSAHVNWNKKKTIFLKEKLFFKILITSTKRNLHQVRCIRWVFITTGHNNAANHRAAKAAFCQSAAHITVTERSLVPRTRTDTLELAQPYFFTHSAVQAWVGMTDGRRCCG